MLLIGHQDIVDTEEGDLTEEDLKNIAKETMKNKEEVGEGEEAENKEETEEARPC